MSDVTRTALLLVAAALLVTLGFMVWLIGADRLFMLAAVLVGAVGLAAIIAASALPIRAYRKRDATGEAHHYHDGTTRVIERHTLDGRAPANNDIRLLQLPAAGQATAFPELLRASFRAGLLAAPGGDQAQPQPAELRELDPATTTANDWNYDVGEFADWRGTLRP